MVRFWLRACLIAAYSALPIDGAAAAVQPDYHAVKGVVYRLQPTTEQHGQYGSVAYGEQHKFDFPACWARSGCVRFDGCNIFDRYTPDSDTPYRIGVYEDIANVVVFYERVLKRLGYPDSVGSATLRDFEAYEVSRKENRDFEASVKEDKYNTTKVPFEGVLSERLVDEMKAYQAAHPELQGPVFMGGCGAGENAVKIETSPPATQVYIIPTFYYELCQAQGLSPDDRNKCDHWREVLAPVEMISGSYRYFVQWPGGVVRRGILNGTQMEITLRKPDF